MEEHVQNEAMPSSNRAFFHVALGNSKEKEKRYDEAWEAVTKAREAKVVIPENTLKKMKKFHLKSAG